MRGVQIKITMCTKFVQKGEKMYASWYKFWGVMMILAIETTLTLGSVWLAGKPPEWVWEEDMEDEKD